jgi:hypothetical protein
MAAVSKWEQRHAESASAILDDPAGLRHRGFVDWRGRCDDPCSKYVVNEPLPELRRR